MRLRTNWSLHDGTLFEEAKARGPANDGPSLQPKGTPNLVDYGRRERVIVCLGENPKPNSLERADHCSRSV